MPLAQGIGQPFLQKTVELPFAVDGIVAPETIVFRVTHATAAATGNHLRKLGIVVDAHLDLRGREAPLFVFEVVGECEGTGVLAALDDP